MPAAAVIPAPRVYIRFVVVKKLVVETRSKLFGELNGVGWHRPAMVGVGGVFLFIHRCSFNEASTSSQGGVFVSFYFEKIRVFKTRSILKRFEATRVVDSYTFNLLNSSAWDNETRPFLFLILLVLQLRNNQRMGND